MPIRDMSIAVITVTFNSSDEIDQLLDSLPAGADGLKLTTIVVDNSSTDDTVAKVEARGDALVVPSGGNLGYAAGINVARRHLPRDVDAIAILNPDLVVDPGALRLLVEPFADRKVGVTVPHIRNADKTPFHSLRREPGLLSTLGEAAFGAKLARRPAVLGDTLRRPADYERERDVDWASGAALVISRECNLAVGEWREDFFLYAEETDFARRVRQQGFVMRYLPQARVMHIGGASGSSPKLDALMEVNKLRDYESHHDAVRSAAFRGLLMGKHWLRRNQPGSAESLRMLKDRSLWSELPHGDRPAIGTEGEN